MHEAFGFGFVRGEGKAGGAPGTLTDAMRARCVKRVQGRRHTNACKACAALKRREMIADMRLDLFNRDAEIRKIMLDQSG